MGDRVEIKYREDERPIESIELKAFNGARYGMIAKRSDSHINDVFVFTRRCNPDDVIEFANALIKLAKQVKRG